MESRLKPGDRVTDDAYSAGTVIDPDTLSREELVEAIALHFSLDETYVRYDLGFIGLVPGEQLLKEEEDEPAPGDPVPPPPWATAAVAEAPVKYAGDDDDSPQAHLKAALGAEILADALVVNGLATLGDLMKRPDRQQLIDEARKRVLAGPAA